MKLLTFESSAVAASVSITDGEKLIAQSFQNCGLTHSCTLLPMAEATMKTCGWSLADIDGFAVSAGPGSFTGIRIGISTVKGLAQGTGKPCVGVSTLEAMAWNLCLTDKVICAVMDARAGQLYNAIFTITSGIPCRITPDRLITLEDLKSELISLNKPYILVGDGAELCYNNMKDFVQALTVAPSNLVYPAAYGVAMLASRYFAEGQGMSADELVPIYLREPQAVRERLAKNLNV